MTASKIDENSRTSQSQPTRIEAFIVDLNGVCRGKWIVGDGVERARSEGLRLPLSTAGTDIFGQDVLDSGLIVESGDQDGEARPIHSGSHAMPWVDNESHQVQLMFYREDDQPFECDPRQVLARVVEAAAERGLRAVVGTELEFYVFDANTNPNAEGGQRETAALLETNMFSIDALHELRPYLENVESACRSLSVPVEGMVIEAGPSQLEVDLGPLDDPLRAADAVIAFRRVARGYARLRGWNASFMPKPLGNYEGSGMHVHMSLIDANGDNVFASDAGEKLLHHAIGGCLEHLAETQLFFAPNANSYRRYVIGGHAPTTATWGQDNRLAALRIPRSSESARRLEHRMPGSDTNPYLAIAAILASALDGIDQATDPGPTSVGNATNTGRFPEPARGWREAIDVFAESNWVAKTFGIELQRVFAACKRQEYNRLLAQIPPAELAAYLEAP